MKRDHTDMLKRKKIRQKPVKAMRRPTRSERQAAEAFFKAPTSNWPQIGIQRRMQSGGG